MILMVIRLIVGWYYNWFKLMYHIWIDTSLCLVYVMGYVCPQIWIFHMGSPSRFGILFLYLHHMMFCFLLWDNGIWNIFVFFYIIWCGLEQYTSLFFGLWCKAGVYFSFGIEIGIRNLRPFWLWWYSLTCTAYWRYLIYIWIHQMVMTTVRIYQAYQLDVSYITISSSDICLIISK